MSKNIRTAQRASALQKALKQILIIFDPDHQVIYHQSIQAQIPTFRENNKNKLALQNKEFTLFSIFSDYQKSVSDSRSQEQKFFNSLSQIGAHG